MKPSIAATEFDLLRNLLRGSGQKDTSGLASELKKADIVEDTKLNRKVVRLNSYVEVADLTLNRILKIRIVLPDQVDLKKCRISVFAPLGAALLGYSEDDQVTWTLAGRQAELKILRVVNE